jgi:hypothetical protein
MGGDVGNVISAISELSTPVANKQLIAAELSDEVIILNLSNGVYYGLDGVGSRIWSLVREQKTVGEIVNAIFAEYEVDAERCRQDVVSLVQRLADEGLVELT